MAFIIFNKNDNSGIYRIAATQTIIDQNKSWNDSIVDVVDVSDDVFNNFRYRTSSFSSRSGNTITWDTGHVVKYHFRSELDDEIASLINSIDIWLDNPGNSNKPMRSSVNTFREYLAGISVSDLITDPSDSATYNASTDSWSDGTPMTKSLIKYCVDQGQTAYHPTELL